MPFLAHREQEAGATQGLVTPEEVGDGVDVYCLECGDRMRPRGGSGEKARHFFHVESVGGNKGCSGLSGGGIGESEQHQVLKSLAVSGLRTRFEDENLSLCSSEVAVDVDDTSSSASVRRADALVEFEEKNQFFGEGVVVEVQYGNEAKNIPQVSQDYLAAGFSVMWAFEDDFTSDRFLLDRFERAFQQQDGTAFSPYSTEPNEIWEVFDPREWFEFSDGWQLEDPKPDCSHEFEHGRDEIECIRCSTEYRRHRGSQLAIYRENNDPMHRPEIVYVRVDDHVEKPEPDDGHPHVHSWRGGYESTKLRCGEFGCQAKKVDGKGEIVIEYTRKSAEELETREMKHCQHEWRRTGSGEECWKCGKEKPDDPYGQSW